MKRTLMAVLLALGLLVAACGEDGAEGGDLEEAAEVDDGAADPAEDDAGADDADGADADEAGDGADEADGADESDAADDGADEADDASADGADDPGADEADDTDESAGDSAGDTLEGVAEQMEAAGTMRFTMEQTGFMDSTTEGVMDQDAGLVEVVTSAAGMDMTTVATPDGTYAYGLFGEQWVDLGGATEEMEELLGEDVDPEELDEWDAYTEATSVTEVGPEDVDGEPATKYELEMDLDAFLGGEMSGMFEDTVVEMWVSDEGYILREVATMTPAEESEVPSSDPMVTTREFFDFGEPVDITVPSDDEVVDMDEAMGGMPDDLNADDLEELEDLDPDDFDLEDFDLDDLDLDALDLDDVLEGSAP